MTSITFERSGGFSGEPINLRVDLDSLPEGESQKLLQLIQDAKFFDIPENSAAPSSARDQFQYTITVDAGIRTHHVVHTDDLSAPLNLRPLIEELSKLAHISPA